MSDRLNRFFDRSHDDFFDSFEDPANLELPRPLQHRPSMPSDPLPSIRSLSGTSGVASNMRFFQDMPSSSPAFPQASQANQTYSSLPDYSRPLAQLGGSQQQQQQQRQPQEPPRTDMFAGPGPTSSIGASHRPTPTAASTSQRPDHPNLSQSSTNLFRPLTASTNPPRELSLPTLTLLPTPVDRRGSYAPTTFNSTIPNDDFHLNQLVSRDFSSPSNPSASPRLPSFNFTTSLPPLNLPPNPRPRLRDPPAPSRDLRSVLGGDSDSADSDSSREFSSAMPRSRGVRRLTLTPLSVHAVASSSTSTAAARRHSPSTQKSNSSAKKRKWSEEVEEAKPSITEDSDVIDLVDKEEVPENLRKEKNWTKLRDFTCIICYEEVTDLTVTFCGHMFCAGCLHSALTIDPQRRVCPVCRQKVDRDPGQGGSFGPRAKGYFPLKLKLMSKQEMEKRKRAQALSSQNDSII